MEIDNKNSEEKEVKQPAEIPEKEKDHVLRTAGHNERQEDPE